MTAIEVFDRGLAMLPTNRQDDTTLNRYVVQWVNTALVETYDIENSIRRSNGKDELKVIPVLTDEQDDVPYSERLVSYAFPYFIASLASKDDEDDYWAQDYRARYLVALNECQRINVEPIKNVYR